VARQHGLLVVHLAHLERRDVLEQPGEQPLGLARAVLDDHDRHPVVGGNAAQDRAHGVQPAPRRADHDEPATHRVGFAAGCHARHRTFR
jgi:hypothetical protein